MGLHTAPYLSIDGHELPLFEQIVIKQSMLNHNEFYLTTHFDFSSSNEKENFFSNSTEFMGKELIVNTKASPEVLEYDNYGNLQFRGIILNITTKHADGHNGNTITIKGKSPTILLDDGPHCNTFVDVTLKEIVDEVISGYPDNQLKLTNQPSFTKKLYYNAQYNQSNWEFMQNRAIRYGEWLYFDGDKTYFGKILTGGDIIELKYAKNLSEVSMDMQIQSTKYAITAKDYKKNQAEIATLDGRNSNFTGYNEKIRETAEGIFPEETTIKHGGNYPENSTKEFLDEIAERQLNGIISNMFFVTGKSEQLNLKLGQRVKFLDSGINGIFYITSVTHFLNGSGDYSNRFEAVPAEAIIPYYTDINHYTKVDNQIAIVKKNSEGSGLGHVKIKFDWQPDEKTTNWVRCARPSAGKKRGMYFMPEVEEEVLVTFEQGDIQRPIVIGSLWNGDQDAILNNTNNDIKILATKKGHLMFKDKDDDTYVGLACDKKIYIKLDATNKSLTLYSEGSINIHADQNINLKAGGEINIDSKKNTQISTKKDYLVNADESIVSSARLEHSVEAKDIKISALNNLSSTAKMNVETEAGVMNTLKGSITQIDGSTLASLTGTVVKIN